MTSLGFDINCDLGEGYGNDAEIMPLIGSCNIACGGHFGDDPSMKKTVLMALENDVHIGAHPSFPDKENFGRVPMEMPETQLLDSLAEQLTSMKDLCQELGALLHHVKLHGALYNLAAKDRMLAESLKNLFLQLLPDTIIYSPYNSNMSEVMRVDFTVWEEAFIDRGYNQDHSLVSRSHPRALLTSGEDCIRQLDSMLRKNEFSSLQSLPIRMKAQTYCIHGDQPGSVQILKSIHQFYQENPL